MIQEVSVMVYDVMVIGGGPGGYLAAERSAHAGLLIPKGGSIPLLCLERVPRLSCAPQDEADLTRKFET